MRIKNNRIIICIVCITFLLGGCSSSKKDIIANAWDALHNSNFSYIEINNYVDEKGDEQSYTVEGEYTADPCIIREKYEEGSSIVEEGYYFKEKDEYKGIIRYNGVWQDAMVGQEEVFFDGYDERDNIKILSKEEKTLDGISYIVCKTEYETSVEDNYELEEKISAVVSQIYYVNKNTKKIERIYTDNTDLSRAHKIAAHMHMDGIGIDEAKEKADSYPSNNTIEVEITYLDEEFVLKIPETKK